MRYHEIASGLRVPVSDEEQALLIRAAKGVARNDLDARERQLAAEMTSRGLMDRRTGRDGMTTYRASSVNDIWRSHLDG